MNSRRASALSVLLGCQPVMSASGTLQTLMPAVSIVRCWRVKRTSPIRAPRSANDPKRTSAIQLLAASPLPRRVPSHPLSFHAKLSVLEATTKRGR